MKENQRKCLKCGAVASEQPKVVLYRFPKPGVRNLKRCELWAKYCFPDKQWSSATFQSKLYTQHKMLCSQHFKRSSFIDEQRKSLYRDAAPDEECQRVEAIGDPAVGPSHLASLSDITNTGRQPGLNPVISASGGSRKMVEGIAEPAAGPSHLASLSDANATNTGRQPDVNPVMPASGGSRSMMEGIAEPAAGPSHLASSSDANATNTGRQPDVNPVMPASGSGGSRSMVDKSGQDIPRQATRWTDHTYSMPTVASKCNQGRRKKDMDPKTEALYKKCRFYVKKICALRNSLAKKKNNKSDILSIVGEDETVKKLSKILTPTFALLLQGQLRNCKRKPQGKRWSKEEKVVALRLYKRSPTCYRLLRRMYHLPSEGTLKTLLGNFHMPVGVHVRVLQSMKNYVAKQTPSNNNFILMFDEMSIRKHVAYNKKNDVIDGYQDHGGNHGRSAVEATYALVFMLAGVRKKVKQPIAHYLSGSYVTADRLAVLIKEVLGSCFDAGINVCATVCDMDGVNRKALTKLGANERDPVIKVNNKEIVSMFDTPHLLKCFRNLLLKYDLKCQVDISSSADSGIGLAKWSHITAFYEMDNANPNFVFAPALTKDHLAPNTKQKMKVKLAAQVLSHSVAAGMYAKIGDGQLPTEATVTANVVSKIDKIFDSVNSDSPDLKNGKPHATNLTEKSPHLQLFADMKRFFRTMKYVGCRSTPPSVEGWVWTLNAIERVWKNLKKEHEDIKSLSTRRLQQDPIENLFGCIRANCGDNSNPTVSQFIGALKTSILSNMAHMGGSGNCEPDDNMAIINHINTILSSPPPSLMSTTNGNEECSLVCDMLLESEGLSEDTVAEDSGELQACAYVCGFLLRNHKIECKVCKEILYARDEDTSATVHNFSKCKEYSDYKQSLKYASKPFIKCVEACATRTNNFFSHSAHTEHLKKKTTFIVAKEVDFDFLKGCSSHLETNKHYITVSVFYICVKRFCVLKNRSYAQERTAMALKKKMDILKHK